MKKLFLLMSLGAVFTAGANESAWQKHLAKEDEKLKAMEVRKRIANESASLLMLNIPMKVDSLHSLVEATPDGEGVVLRFSADAIKHSMFKDLEREPELSFMNIYKEQAVEGFGIQYCLGEYISYYARVGMPVQFILTFSDGPEIVRKTITADMCEGIVAEYEKKLASGTKAPTK